MNNKLVKKVSAVALSATTVIWLSGASMLIPTLASAQSVEAQIQALLAQIAQLQAQLAAAQGGSTTSSSCSFTRDLTMGAKGDDVKCLQMFLNGAGHKVAASGPGSPGNETTYFGNATKAAVASWQKANGLPSTGYFGPLSRSKAAGGVVTPGPGPVAVPGSGLAISLASDSPMGSAIAGAGQIDVHKMVLTASALAGVTVTDLTFMRTGVVSDSNVSNLYLADEKGVIFAQYASLNNGVAQFNGLNLQVNAGTSRAVTLRMDLSSSATAGNTLGWKLTEVKAGGAAVSGLPVTSKDLTVTTVSNPSLATVTYTVQSSGTTVDAGTTGFLLHAGNIAVTNSASLLKSIKFTLVGSANKADIRNLRLTINGVEVASAATVGETVTLVPTSQVRLSTGNSRLELYADIMGSPNRTVEVEVIRPYDMVYNDTQYGTNITPSVTDLSNQVTINQGRVTVSKATDTPTGNIPAGASNVTLSKFNFYAGGEPVRIRFLPITLTNAGDASGAINGDIRNVSITDDVGNSVGTTISSPGATNCGSANWSSNAATCDFGTSSSYINYIIPANTTRVLAVKVDVQSGADITSLRADLATPGSANLEGQISFQTSTSATASGNTLTVVTTPLTVTSNASFGAPTYVAGANNIRVASFVLTASSAEGVKVSTLTFDKDSNANFDVKNLRVMVGGTQFGTTQATVADAETAMTFSGSTPINVPAGGSVTVDLFADILTSSTSATHSAVFDMTARSGTGAVSNSAIPTTFTAVNGQNIVISSGSTLTLATDSDNVPALYRVMGSSGNVLYKLRITNDNVEDVRVTDVAFRDTITGNTAGRTSYTDLELFDDAGTKLAGPISIILGSDNQTTGTVSFALGSQSPLVVSKNGSKTVTLKGSVASFEAGAVSNSGHTFSINATSAVTAYGKDSSATATISGTPSGTAQTVYRTKPSLSNSVLGASTARIRKAVDEVATMNWGADANYQVVVGTVALKFSGGAVSGTTAAAFTVSLIDANTNSTWGSSSQQTCTPSGGSCSVTFAPAFTVSRGTTKAVKVRVNSSAFNNAANSGDGMSAIVNANTDIEWEDGSTIEIPWESYRIPSPDGLVVDVSYE